MKFGEAINQLKKGNSVRRIAWSKERNAFLKICHYNDIPDAISFIEQGIEVNYRPQSRDMLAKDWYIVE